ncbi:MAG: hypothetical protein CMQ55_04035 [Gammaproteobacteria bacterium]|nr:hypothetical protein [Gammaproteobacteria bacterium]
MLLVDKIKSHNNNLSPKLRQASESILSTLNQIPFQTIRQTAYKAEVSVLTVSRLNKIWGFDGYSDFQLHVKNLFYSNNTKKENENFLNIKKVEESKSIDLAAKILTQSDSVYISGFRSAKSFALYMNYMGRMVFDNFFLMPDSGLSAAQDLARLGKKNLLVAFSTTPYSTETVRLIKAAKTLNIKTLSFTDNTFSPLAKHSDYVVIVSIAKENRLYKMAPMISAIEKVLEKSFEFLGEDVDNKIKYFQDRVNAINGYW